MKLTENLLKQSLRDYGYTEQQIVHIALTKDYTKSYNTPEISMFSVKIRNDYISDSVIVSMERWCKKFNWRLHYWRVSCEGWANLNADTNKKTYFIEITYKFRRVEK